MKQKQRQRQQLLPSFAFDSSLPSTLIVIELPEVRTKTDTSRERGEWSVGKYFQFGTSRDWVRSGGGEGGQAAWAM